MPSVQDGGAGLGALILYRFRHEHLANIDSFGYTSQLLCSQEPGSPTSRWLSTKPEAEAMLAGVTLVPPRWEK